MVQYLFPTFIIMFELIEKIYEWNDRVDKMRDEWKFFSYSKWCSLIIEELFETVTWLIDKNDAETADWLWDIFFVLVWELKNQWATAKEVYETVCVHRNNYPTRRTFTFEQELWTTLNLLDRKFGRENEYKIINEIIDSNFTRFSEWCFVNENWKFIKGYEYRKPNFSFLCLPENK